MTIQKRIKALIHGIPVLGPTALKCILKISDSTDLYYGPEDFYASIPKPLVVHSQEKDQNRFYLAFENVFRGDEHEISRRQSVYLQYIRQKQVAGGNGELFLDVGCGRGEFLKILKQARIPAKGLEINEIEQKELQTQGLDVERHDVISYLSTTPKNFSGISALQVIEHLKTDELSDFIRLAFARLEKGSPIIIETVNPKCSLALANFYLDPTHKRPYPPELLQFILEWNGFTDVSILFSAKCPKDLCVKSHISHNYMDYAAIGWKR